MKTPRHVVAKALTDWVEKAGDRPANQLKLMHIPEGRPPAKVQGWIVTWPGTNLQELTTTILDVATEVANNSKGATVEQFHIIPYFGTELEEGGFRSFTVHVANGMTTEEGNSYTEGPTKTGMIHMDMRHLENRHRQVDERDALLWDKTSRELERLSKENQALRAELRMANEGLEEAKDKSLERKLAIYKANQEEDRKNQLVSAIIPVGMQLANAAMGAPIFSVNSDDMSQKAVVSFLMSLNSKQIEHFHQAMEPQQKMFFDHVMGEIIKMKKAQLAQEQAEAQAKVNGVEQDPRTVENMAKRRPEQETQP